MALKIETFKNADLSDGCGPATIPAAQRCFKALGHPASVQMGRALAAKLSSAGSLAIFDPTCAIGNFNAFFDISGSKVEDYFVQRIEDLSTSFQGVAAKPASKLCNDKGKDCVRRRL